MKEHGKALEELKRKHDEAMAEKLKLFEAQKKELLEQMDRDKIGIRNELEEKH